MFKTKVVLFVRLSMAAFLMLSLCGPARAQSELPSVTQNKQQISHKIATKEEVKTPQYGVGRPMGDSYATSALTPADKSRLVVYRNPNPKQPSVITVYINGSYVHFALQTEAPYVSAQPTDIQPDMAVRDHVFLPSADVQRWFGTEKSK